VADWDGMGLAARLTRAGAALVGVMAFGLAGCSADSSAEDAAAESTVTTVDDSGDDASDTDASDTDASSENDTIGEADGGDVDCPAVIELNDAVNAFLNDGLDPAPPRAVPVAELQAMLTRLSDAAAAVEGSASGPLQEAADGISATIEGFAVLLPQASAESTQSGDRPIDGQLNDLIGTFDFETLEDAVESCS
jgi:hypothetical protein